MIGIYLLINIGKKKKSQVELMNETDMYKVHTSRTLKELSERNTS